DAGLPRATAMNSSRAVPSGLPLDGPGTRAALPSESSERDTPTNGLDPGRVALTRPGEEDASAMQWAAEQALAEGTVPDFRWLIASDVCKHCTHAGCLDVCPTGALFRTEFGTVVVQDEVCNGCGYCVAACPFGVIDKRKDPTTTGAARQVEIGIANKCTLCYDRISLDAKPACAQACPTTSIQFGDLDEMRERARERVEALHANGFTEARLYGANPNDGVGGTGSVFLLLDEPEVYGLPPDPIVTTHDLPDIFRKAGLAGLTMLAGAAVSFLGRGNS
ncbi:MAG: 4Fe-4S dicluster domain-containing protein, partial [Tetrasphaera sp.]|nr:4Fe-4S dicluster domain-containing protein [Tetrasphaera sp.]